jgi:hypothetical protein
VTLRRLVGVVRLYRLSLRQRAQDADADGRPDYALACWHVLQDVGAFLEYLTKRKE